MCVLFEPVGYTAIYLSRTFFVLHIISRLACRYGPKNVASPGCPLPHCPQLTAPVSRPTPHSPSLQFCTRYVKQIRTPFSGINLRRYLAEGSNGSHLRLVFIRHVATPSGRSPPCPLVTSEYSSVLWPHGERRPPPPPPHTRTHTHTRTHHSLSHTWHAATKLVLCRPYPLDTFSHRHSK